MEQEIMLKSYRKEIEILELTMEVPVYEGERAKYFPKYEDILLKFFNNKREDKDILEIRNYYGSNEITLVVDLTGYTENSYWESKEDSIEYLKEWFKCGLDIADEDVKTYITKGYRYSIPEYDLKGINNYIVVEE